MDEIEDGIAKFTNLYGEDRFYTCIMGSRGHVFDHPAETTEGVIDAVNALLVLKGLEPLNIELL